MTALAPADPRDAPFSDLRVIELAEDPAGEMTGYLLAISGAEVLKLEPAGGTPTRAVGPFRAGSEDSADSLNFWYYNSGKKSLRIDPADAGQRPAFDALLGGADIFLTTLQPAALAERGIDLAAIAAANPRLILLSLTAYGLTGPRKDWKSSELVALANGGPLHLCGYDDHMIPPILPGGNQAYHIASSFALKAVLVALIERQMSGEGQIIDVSMHEACAVTVELGNPYWFYPKAIVQRQTCRQAQPTPTQQTLFECADGRYVILPLMLSEQKAWTTLVDWLDSKGLAAQLTDPAYADRAFRRDNFPDVQQVLECFFLTQMAQDAFLEGQARGLPVGVVNAPEDLYADAHLNARNFFTEVDHGEAGTVRYPGAPFWFSGFDLARRTRAPLLGEHDALIPQG